MHHHHTHQKQRLYGISDLHAGRPPTWNMLKALSTTHDYHDDWLICAGDICDGWAMDRFNETLTLLTGCFAKVFWTCGNHELYTLPGKKDSEQLKGVAKYDQLVNICRNHGVITPEDAYEKWTGPRSKLANNKPFNSFTSNPEKGQFDYEDFNEDSSNDRDAVKPLYICPIFTLYDYSFRPKNIPLEKAIDWAQETKVMCSDEYSLHCEPYSSKVDWCKARVESTARRLDKLTEDGSHTILASHFALKYDSVYSPYIPRFSIWCGTQLTEDWHNKYNAEAVIYGHTHVRSSTVIDNCQFHEVSLGFPTQYSSQHKITDYLCQILPARSSIEGCNIM